MVHETVSRLGLQQRADWQVEMQGRSPDFFRLGQWRENPPRFPIYEDPRRDALVDNIVKADRRADLALARQGLGPVVPPLPPDPPPRRRLQSA